MTPENIEEIKILAVTIIEGLIWITLAVGTLIMVLKAVGLLPKTLQDKIERNEANDIKELFYRLKITPHYFVDSMRSMALGYLSNSNNLNDKTIKKKLNEIIKDRTFKHSLAWGDDNTDVEIKKYVDLQGLTFIPEINRQLATFIEKLVENRIKNSIVTDTPFVFDCIAVHENAAPFLGYEVSSRLRVPLIYVKDEHWNKFPDIILHGHEVSKDRRNFLNSGEKLTKAIFIADFLMLGPHLDEARKYLARFGIELEDVFLLAHKDIDNSREKIRRNGYNLNFWVSLGE